MSADNQTVTNPMTQLDYAERRLEDRDTGTQSASALLSGLACGMGVLSLPLFWLMIQPSVLVILIAQCTFAAILSLLSGGMAAFMVQAFPKHLRCSGLSVGYNVAVSVFGGSLPLVATFMIERSGYALSPAIYVSLISIVAFMVMVASVRGLQRYATA